MEYFSNKPNIKLESKNIKLEHKKMNIYFKPIINPIIKIKKQIK